MPLANPPDIKEIVASLFVLGTIAAGCWMIWLGYELTTRQKKIGRTVHGAVTEVHKAIFPHSNIEGPEENEQGNSTQQENEQENSTSPHIDVGSAAQYVKALAELSANLGNLTPAIASFIISTILFFIAAGAVGALILKL